MTFKTRTFIYLLLLFFTGLPHLNLKAQEMLTPLYHNNVIRSYLAKQANNPAAMKMSMASDTLQLPVIDDFSGPGIFPNPEIWEPHNTVFISPGYAANAPTVGMATFDGLDATGNPYDNSQATLYSATDTLESKNINLFDDNNGNQYTPADNITLSFYYQRRGLGDVPEYGDSLSLEFYVPDSATWYWAWSMDGGTFDFSFQRVLVPVTDPVFLKKGFKFRFRSYGSPTGSLDNWNLDYVTLRKPFFTNDTTVNDIGYALQAHSMIQNYTSIPYDHYKSMGGGNQAALMIAQDHLSVFNLFNTASAPSQVNFRIIDQFGNLQYLYSTSGANNIVIGAYDVDTYDYPIPPFTYKFPDTIPGDYAEFELIDNLASPNQDFNKSNDTVRYNQIFANYYAYDDGSAEAGYSLVNAPGGKLAYQFNLLKQDTLRGLYIHWNQMNANVSQKLFKMVVYASITPEQIIYQEFNQKPIYDDSINGFAFYPFDSIVVLPAGSFFVGLTQSAADALNLGFDRNINSNSKMWYNTVGTWNPSGVQGSYMFRPAFGDTVLVLTETKEIADANTDFKVYPNPASDVVHVQADVKSLENIYYDITDLAGRKIKQSVHFERVIDVSGFHRGFYFITFYDSSHRCLSVKKLLIQRQ